MDYRIKSHSCFNKGFSLLELLIVIGIFAIFATLTTSVYYDTRSNTNLELTTGTLVEAVRYAQSSAQSGKGDSKWGVEIIAKQVIVFKGSTYASRDITSDRVSDFSSGVTASGLSEIVFEKTTGVTTNTGAVVLTNSSGTKNVSVNSKGVVNY